MWQTIGHDWAIDLLQHALHNERLAHAYLFAGLERIGKNTLAAEFAAAINCTGLVAPCRECTSCHKVFSGTHPDVVSITPQNGKIKIEQIREMQRQVALSPYEGRYRVCIINDLHLTTIEAANALLKTLEEPPKRVVLLLTTTHLEHLLPTVISRCQVLQLRPVAAQLVQQTLRHQEGQTAAQADLISRWAAGRLGWAIAVAREPALLAAHRKQLDSLVQLMGLGKGERLRAAEALSKKDNLREILQLWQVWWRDIVLVASGNEPLVTNADHLEQLKDAAQVYGLGTASWVYRSVGDTMLQLDQNVNPRLALEGLVLKWDKPLAARIIN